MKLDKLIHWRLEGTPDVFTEQRDGEEWMVIHSGGAVHQAGFSQVVEFDRPVKAVFLSAIASLYTTGGGLMIRLGIQHGREADWSGWFGPDNGWTGEQPALLKHGVYDLNTKRVTAFLESKCRYPVRANTSRWRDVRLEVEYVGTEPEEPEPPDPDQGIAGQIVALLDEVEQQLTEIKGQLDQVGAWLSQWDQGQAWVDEYNRSLIDE